MSKYLIAGNWKMNTILDDAKRITNILHTNDSFDPEVEMLICPPFTHLSFLSETLDFSRISLGAQNSYFEEKGAYTGEISNQMLISVGCEYVILGHSERRSLFYETDELINKKVISALRAGLRVILCIGETLEQRKSGDTNDILNTQLLNCLENVNFSIENLKIAYEPVWAIGTGMTPTTEQIAETHKFIRNKLKSKYPSNSIKILYGGSLNPNNSDNILSIENVNGGLIGGAALDAESFINIYKSAIKLI